MIEFICPKCKNETEDTIGGFLVDGFLLECSYCYEITVVHFVDDAKQTVAEINQ